MEISQVRWELAGFGSSLGSRVGSRVALPDNCPNRQDALEHLS
jgi:hypothetical protein